MIADLLNEIRYLSDKSVFKPSLDALTKEDWIDIYDSFKYDYENYYPTGFDVQNVKYFPGLIATLFYRISRHLFLNNKITDAQEYSSLGYSYSAMEIYYSSNIGKSLKINHGIGTIIGARTTIGDNVILHHNVTLGDKNGGRPTLGNNVIVYPGAVIVGDISIGDNSVVGANSFVDKSYPSNSIIK
ncbi:serine acetyltransferase [Sinomicrobium pectinilyticum]|uniref:Serine acetyltransferase n=1 Tax=Sinomicrobium pectinilyticum TaxID=1084421 RepID=A0A3N0E197_SINP1|nr:serine acetyltransferase [Sinomicrobium pectinilyticum]RNL81622.1 serine acetyltransferase [Sinomicrobium pectinilyticum]